ncbi:MAG: cupin domain-containing protein, partial [Ilumatobacteraceae bacterium]
GVVLPTGRVMTDRGFGPDGHRFVFHRAAEATYEPWHLGGGFEQRDTGIGAATDGLAGVRVVRPSVDRAASPIVRHTAEFWFGFVLSGAVDLEIDGQTVTLVDGDAVTIPSATPFRWSAASSDLELLEVTLPHAAPTTPA